MDLQAIQDSLRAKKLDGWLFFDHHRRDPLAYRILGLSTSLQVSRRWYYFVPAAGEPRKLVHRIENHTLDALPGPKLAYANWSDQVAQLQNVLNNSARIAMQYSPNCAVPYVSLVDGGTLELIKSLGVSVSSSADLVQEFEARWTARQFDMHIEAGKRVDQVRRDAFDLIGARLRLKETITEHEVQQFILGRFSQSELTTDHGPIVAVNENASDPHYEPLRDRSENIEFGDLVLIDLWAKLMDPDAVYYDVTWTGFCGERIPDKIQNVFEAVRDARKNASQFVIDHIGKGEQLRGFQVDDAARGLIGQRGYGDFFFHRTGHSIGTDVHGTGANMDNLESHDERLLIPDTCFSIEPGIYLPDFGVRSEVNVFVGQNTAEVTGEEQEQLIRI